MKQTPVQRLKTFLEQEAKIANSKTEYYKRNIYRDIIDQCILLLSIEKEFSKDSFNTGRRGLSYTSENLSFEDYYKQFEK